MTKSNLRRKGFALHVVLQSVMEGSQVRNSRQEPGGGNWSQGQGRMLLTDLLPLTGSAAFPIEPGPNFPRMTLPTLGWAFLCIYQQSRKCPAGRPMGQPDERDSSVEVASSQVLQFVSSWQKRINNSESSGFFIWGLSMWNTLNCFHFKHWKTEGELTACWPSQKRMQPGTGRKPNAWVPQRHTNTAACVSSALTEILVLDADTSDVLWKAD